MNVRFFFIYPPSRMMNREDRCQVPTGSIVISPTIPPTDLLYLAAVAEQEGCVCRVIDYTLDGRTQGDLVRDLSEFMPHYVVISATMPSCDLDFQNCASIKRTVPGVKIVAKGALFLKNGNAVLERYPELDMAIAGEAECAIKDLVLGKPLTEIPGLIWRSGGVVVCNAGRPLVEDLDTLPMPARHLIDNSLYVRPDNGKIQGVIKVSRGCPFNCFFCLATPVSGGKVRTRSPQNILAELAHCVDVYGMKDFIFWSDVFNADRRWVMELCRAIIERGLDITWAANMRADNVDAEMVGLMRQAGCSLVSVGVESGDQALLDKMGKKITLAQIKKAFALLHRAGMRTFAYYLIGLPWETRESAESTMRLSVELKSDYANFFVATPFPGTAYFEYAVQHGMLESREFHTSWLFGDAYASSVVQGHFMQRTEVDMLYRKALKNFYLRPAYILRRLWKVRSGRELLGYYRAAAAILSNT